MLAIVISTVKAPNSYIDMYNFPLGGVIGHAQTHKRQSSRKRLSAGQIETIIDGLSGIAAAPGRKGPQCRLVCPLTCKSMSQLCHARRANRNVVFNHAYLVTAIRPIKGRREYTQMAGHSAFAAHRLVGARLTFHIRPDCTVVDCDGEVVFHYIKVPMLTALAN
jgi:hypothetical protein